MPVTAIKKEPQPIRASHELLGMSWDDAVSMFVMSRKRGTEGAKTQGRERSIREYTHDLTIFTRFMQDHDIRFYNQMKRLHVVEFVDWVQETNPKDWRRKAWAKASQNKVLRSLRAFFRWVDHSEECREEYMRGYQTCLPVIPRNAKKPTIPSKADIKKFMDGFNTSTRAGLRDYTISSLILDAGLRTGEIRFMRVPHVHINKVKTPFLRVPEEGKTGERVVYISEEMERLLRRWLRRRETFAPEQSDFLFITDGGEPLAELRLAHNFRNHRARVGVKDITPHSLRHYFSTDWIRNGGSLAELQAMTGHESLDTLSIYLHLANDESVAKAQRKSSPLRGLAKQ